MQKDDIVLIKWLNGLGAVINYLDDTTRVWQQQRLHNFVSNNSLNSLQFDGVTETHLPHCVYSETVNAIVEYTGQYNQFVESQSYQSTPVVSVGYFSQSNAVLFRLADRNTFIVGSEQRTAFCFNFRSFSGIGWVPVCFPGHQWSGI